MHVEKSKRLATAIHHSSTHLLHAALKKVLGEHVQQKGSLVDETKLRFDFSHPKPLSKDEIASIEEIVNRESLNNLEVKTEVMDLDDAISSGAQALFGEKYEDEVRVLSMGDKSFSVELCGGTHVGALGDIGIVKVVTESSIGSNLRRIEAVTGANAVEYVLAHHRTLTAAASLLGAQPSELVSAIQRKIDENKALGEELRSLRSVQATSRASEMAASAQGGVVVSRVDGVTPNELRELALAIRQNAAIKIVVLGGVTDTGGVALVATVSSDVSVAAGERIRDAAKAVGGGGGGKGDIATAGGKDPSAIDAALELARSAVAKVLST